MAKDQSFKPDYRLLNKHDFSLVFEDATRIVVPPFTLLFRANRLDSARLGMVIGKKAVNRSVGRNRIRRIIRENFRLSRSVLPSLDLIVLARRDIDQFPVSELNSKLAKLWQRLGHG